MPSRKKNTKDNKTGGGDCRDGLIDLKQNEGQTRWTKKPGASKKGEWG